MIRVEGGVTAPLGFLASGVSCGIKRRGKDMALLLSEKTAVVAGTLTRNAVRASCVNWVQAALQRGVARALVANSGNANSCTGRRGEKNTAEMARLASSELGLIPSQVLVASTGVIGHFLPMDRVRTGIQEASMSLSRTGSLSAAEAILTTDTRPKELAVRFRVAGHPITIGGIAKGSGMVSPHLATLLAFLTTDANIELAALRGAVRAAVGESFNAITVDGEMSTNDMVLVLANGACEGPVIRRGSAPYRKFLKALITVSRFLAHEIVRDGEGVTRLLAVYVTGAKNKESAAKVARQVAQSLLVKTMVAGRDPNWGRVAAAVGASCVSLNMDKLTIRLGKTVVFRKGEPTSPGHEKLLNAVDQPEVQVGIDLGGGTHHAQILSGDLTEGYVRINAKYTT